MTIDKKSTVWTCEDCGYKLSADEFEDNYVFWFCDECQKLQTERSKVQADYRNPDLDIDYRGDLWDLLHEFDAAIGEKQ